MGLVSVWTWGLIGGWSGVFATQLSRGGGLPSAVAGTMPVSTAKYPKPTSAVIVKMTPRMKLAINLIYILSRCKQGFGQVINSGSLEARNLFGYWLSAIGHLLDPRAIWYDGILWDHDYSVAHVKFLRIQVGGFAICGDYYPLADPSVFVDDCAIDDGISTDAQGRHVSIALIQFVLVKISTHDHRISDRRAGFNLAANTDNRALDLRICSND